MYTFRHIVVFDIVGVIVLLIGIGSASLAYRRTQPVPADANTVWQDSTLSLMDSKTSTRNIELYGGKVEVLMVKWQEWLRRPESLTVLIITISTLIAAGCFLAGRYLSAARASTRQR